MNSMQLKPDISKEVYESSILDIWICYVQEL